MTKKSGWQKRMTKKNKRQADKKGDDTTEKVKVKVSWLFLWFSPLIRFGLKTFTFQNILDETMARIEHLGEAQPRQRNGNEGQQQGPSSSPAPSNIRADSIFCGDPHFASVGEIHNTLGAMRRRAFQLRKCKRCLFEANHMATSCISATVSIVVYSIVRFIPITIINKIVL